MGNLICIPESDKALSLAVSTNIASTDTASTDGVHTAEATFQTKITFPEKEEQIKIANFICKKESS